LEVAHFNHRLRGADADADADWVRAEAARRELPCHVEAGDVRAHATARKLSVEMAARELRHAFLARTAQRLGMNTVALGHHADDQVETFFLRLFRGEAGVGIQGLRWSNPSPADPGVRLVRPLLGCSRAELRAFARENGLPWREDASNAQPDTLRNRIRHQLLSRLETDFQPGLRTVIPRWIEVAGANAELAASQAADWRARLKPPFATLHPAVQREVIRQQLWQLGVTPTFAHIEHLRQRPDRPLTLAPGTQVWRDAAGQVHRDAPSDAPGFRPDRQTLELTAPQGRANFGGVELAWEILDGPPRFPVRPPAGTEFLDADRVGRRGLLRHWQPGDRFQPLGFPGPAKLQDLFVNQRVPRAKRHRRVLLENEAGVIVWVEGLRPGEPARLRPDTRRRLRWSWHPASGT
jgi:tRNA(Ile)-lysidine synthase